MRNNAIDLAYVVAAGLFIVGLKGICHPTTARRGVRYGEAGMLVAVVATLVSRQIVSYQWIVLALVVGSGIGAAMAHFMPMTAMPQRIALSHAFGALAAALVGTSEFYLRTPNLGHFTMGALGVEVLLGFLTFTGSLMAFAKLQGVLPGRPITYRGQNVVNLSVLAVALAIVAYLIVAPGHTELFPLLTALSLAFGVMLIVPIGGADMPTVISLLNSYAGLSGAAMGFVLNNKVLIVAGALDGSSGLLLSVIMCRAMNRSFTNVIFGAFGKLEEGSAERADEERVVHRGSAEEAAMILETARSVIIVPGYGLAVAQAQHKVRELADALAKRGVDVKYAIHPVAGRMPGHMNVLLAEADVPYDQIFDMDSVNSEFSQADVALVIGANDVTNPAARTVKDSPIYGMPVLDVDKAASVMVVKRSMSPGFAGIENELYYLDKTMMLFGDAKTVASDLVNELPKVGTGV
ncbi:MAG: NAD synthetase [Acidimicrobiales bacterium]|nr:MAG: NAD synthetase [Acidimicrobiales bacterium]